MFGLWFAWFTGWSQGGGTFADTPDHEWFKEGLAIAKREKFLSPYPGCIGLGESRPPSRYEQAVYFHATVTSHLNRLYDALEGKADTLDRASVLRSNALVPFYLRATTEFTPELLNLGVTEEFGVGRIGFLTARLAEKSLPQEFPFADVPLIHWASKAVGDLRALGLLDGYPDERFEHRTLKTNR